MDKLNLTNSLFVYFFEYDINRAQDKVVKNTHKVNKLQTEEKILKRKIREKEKEYFLSQKDKGKGKKKKLPKEVQEKIDKIQEKIEKIQEKQNEISEKVQDQGFTRGRVLILVPSQEIAGNLVELIMKFINKNQVHHKSRFYEYFLPEDRDMEPHQFKPFDYNVLFNGNSNDAFYICLQFSFHSIKLFSDPLKSDIIISSPLGIRSIVDKSDQRGRFDFLSSIELLVLDFSDFFLMQNWDHVSYIFKHINCVPQLQRDIDFSRVKPYFLDGLFVSPSFPSPLSFPPSPFPFFTPFLLQSSSFPLSGPSFLSPHPSSLSPIPSPSFLSPLLYSFILFLGWVIISFPFIFSIPFSSHSFIIPFLTTSPTSYTWKQILNLHLN